MSVPTKTTQEVADEIVADVGGELGQTVPFLKRAFVRVIAKAFSGLYAILYRYGGFIFLQLFVATATMKETTILGKRRRPLVDHGRLLGAGDPIEAQRAELVIGVVCKTNVGDLPAEATLLHEESGQLYRTAFAKPLSQAVPTVVDGVTVQQLSVTVRANDAGELGSRAAGDRLLFAQPLGSVGTEARVLSTTVAGQNEESPVDYRRRVEQRRKRPPQGGAYADYWIWAREVVGIINAYPYAGPPMHVHVYCEASEESSGSADGFPTNDQLTAVATSIQKSESGLASRRPIGAAVTVFSISRVQYTVTVTGLTPNKPETRTAIQDGVEDHLRSREPYIDGLSSLPRQDRISKDEIGGIVSQIARAHGATVTSVSVSPGPVSTLGAGQKAKLGNGGAVIWA